MQNKPILAAGSSLFEWIRAGGSIERGSWHHMLLYRWRAMWLEESYKILRQGKIQSPITSEKLIFIMGFWRSGTTVLHEFLSRAPRCDAPRTWQCMDPSALLLGKSPTFNPKTKRPMDNVIVDPESPQEDEFALLALGLPSLYRGFLDPRRLPELHELLYPSYWESAGTEWLTTLEAFLSLCRQNSDNQMIVKSPNHLFRYQTLLKKYPQAKFVWILRSPRDIWRSNCEMWRIMTDYYGLWTQKGNEIEDFLINAFTAYGHILKQLHKERTFRNQIVFSYESLITNPTDVLRPMVHELGFEPWDTWGPSALAATGITQTKRRAPALFTTKNSPDDLLNNLEDLHSTILQAP